MPIDPRSLRKRKNSESQFKALSYMAISVAGIFLVVFFADIIRQGYTAFQQTEIRTSVTFSQSIFDDPRSALDKKLIPLVSRGVTRILPMQLRENPQLLGTTSEIWVLANAEVDQYVKGKPNRLKPKEIELVDELVAQGAVKKAFNVGFFTNGDSKLAEMADRMPARISDFLGRCSYSSKRARASRTSGSPACPGNETRKRSSSARAPFTSSMSSSSIAFAADALGANPEVDPPLASCSNRSAASWYSFFFQRAIPSKKSDGSLNPLPG